jgi:4'-phosphopantetheinyl transferase
VPRAVRPFEVVVARLDAPAEALQPLLCPGERERAARFRFDRDRRRYIVARGRLRQLLGERLGVLPETLEIRQGINGKPHLADGALHFNLSHSEDVALFAFSRSGEIGVDIEPLRDEPLEFLYCWTRTEALAKALGTGLSMSGEHVDGWSLHSFFPLPGFIAAVACRYG